MIDNEGTDRRCWRVSVLVSVIDIDLGADVEEERIAACFFVVCYQNFVGEPVGEECSVGIGYVYGCVGIRVSEFPACCWGGIDEWSAPVVDCGVVGEEGIADQGRLALTDDDGIGEVREIIQCDIDIAGGVPVGLDVVVDHLGTNEGAHFGHKVQKLFVTRGRYIGGEIIEFDLLGIRVRNGHVVLIEDLRCFGPEHRIFGQEASGIELRRKWHGVF